MKNKLEDSVASGAASFLFLGLIVIMGATLAIIDGLVVQHLWNWYLPHAINAPHIGTIDSIGICTLVGYMTTAATMKCEEDSTKMFAFAIVIILSALAVGWIALQFR